MQKLCSSKAKLADEMWAMQKRSDHTQTWMDITFIYTGQRSLKQIRLWDQKQNIVT